jgi:hypothetical protein
MMLILAGHPSRCHRRLPSIGAAEKLEHTFVYGADVTSLPLQFEFSFEDRNNRFRFVDCSINDVGIS